MSRFEAQHEVYLLTDSGQRLGLLSNHGGFSYTYTLNDRGYFSIVLPSQSGVSLLPAGQFASGLSSGAGALVRKDQRLEFWRQPPGGPLRRNFTGLVRRRLQQRIGQQAMLRQAAGVGLNDLLRRRVITYEAGSAQAEMTDSAGDMMAEVVKDNLGSDAAAARQLSSALFSAPTVSGIGPSLTKAFSYRTVLDVLREISDAARAQDEEIYFGIVPSDERALSFRVVKDAWGRDRTSYGQRFGSAWGSLADPRLEEDASDEVNHVYGLGRGEEDQHNVQEAQDAESVGASVFGRCEGVVLALDQSDDNGILGRAQAQLAASKPVTTFSARLLDVPGSRYQLDWDVGDLLPVDEFGMQFNALVWGVTVSVDGAGQERIEAQIEARLLASEL